MPAGRQKRSFNRVTISKDIFREEKIETGLTVVCQKLFGIVYLIVSCFHMKYNLKAGIIDWLSRAFRCLVDKTVVFHDLFRFY